MVLDGYRMEEPSYGKLCRFFSPLAQCFSYHLAWSQGRVTREQICAKYLCTWISEAQIFHKLGCENVISGYPENSPYLGFSSILPFKQSTPSFHRSVQDFQNHRMLRATNLFSYTSEVTWFNMISAKLRGMSPKVWHGFVGLQALAPLTLDGSLLRHLSQSSWQSADSVNYNKKRSKACLLKYISFKVSGVFSKFNLFKFGSSQSPSAFGPQLQLTVWSTKFPVPNPRINTASKSVQTDSPSRNKDCSSGISDKFADAFHKLNAWVSFFSWSWVLHLCFFPTYVYFFVVT